MLISHAEVLEEQEPFTFPYKLPDIPYSDDELYEMYVDKIEHKYDDIYVYKGHKMNLRGVYRCETNKLCYNNVINNKLSMGLLRTHLEWKIVKTEGEKLYMEALYSKSKQEGYFFYDHKDKPRISITLEEINNDRNTNI